MRSSAPPRPSPPPAPTRTATPPSRSCAGSVAASIGAAGRPKAATGLASLTGRELEIAALIVDRRTNQEIADQLFLSTKTIESHLRNMFRKLDVSSRIELARAVEHSL